MVRSISFCSNSWGSRGSVVLSQLWCPKEQVVAQELHNQCGVLVVFVLDTIQISDGFIESGTGHSTSLLRVLKDFVVEDWMVKGKAQLQRVCVAQRLLGQSGSLLVGAESFVRNRCLLISSWKLCNIAHEISFHLFKENFRFVSLRVDKEGFVDEVKDVLANACKFCLNLLFVVLNFLDVLGVALDVLLLLNGGEDSPGRAPSTHNILKGDSQNVSLLKRQLLGARLGKLSWVAAHFYLHRKIRKTVQKRQIRNGKEAKNLLTLGSKIFLVKVLIII